MNHKMRPASFGKSLGAAIRENPLPAALIGMGLIWLVTGPRQIGSAASGIRDAGGRMADTAAAGWTRGHEALQTGMNTLGQGAGELALQTADVAQKTGVAVSDVVGNLRDTIASKLVTTPTTSAKADTQKEFREASANVFTDVRSGIKSVFEKQPLALGAIGIAVGAAIASSFTSTELENSIAGSKSDDLKKVATEFVSAQTNRASGLATAVRDTVIQEANNQGLSLAGAKSAAQTTAASLHSIGDAAASSVRERV